MRHSWIVLGWLYLCVTFENRWSGFQGVDDDDSSSSSCHAEVGSGWVCDLCERLLSNHSDDFVKKLVPNNSLFHISALKDQLKDLEWRCHFPFESLIKWVSGRMNNNCLTRCGHHQGQEDPSMMTSAWRLIVILINLFWKDRYPHISGAQRQWDFKIIRTCTFLWLVILTINHNLFSVPSVLKFRNLKVYLSESWEIVPQML